MSAPENMIASTSPVMNDAFPELCAPYTIDEDGHFVGEDGYVCPRNFAEFNENHPDFVRMWVGNRPIPDADRAQCEAGLRELLASVPENSKFRESGYNGHPNGCTDRVMVFTPELGYGASHSHFFGYINHTLGTAWTQLFVHLYQYNSGEYA